MLSGGGITPDQRLVQTKHKGFIIPVKVIGRMFRGKFMSALKKLYDSKTLCLTGAVKQLSDPKHWQALIDSLYRKDWIPFIKETFNGNGNAVKYLARYAYRTAISNVRVSDVTAETVTVSYKDYADNSRKKQMVLSGTEFIRRFMLHVLPKGVHRVRFSGYLSNCKKTKCLTLIGNLTRTPYAGNPTKGKCMSELLEMIYGTNSYVCPTCKTRMILYQKIRAPEEW